MTVEGEQQPWIRYNCITTRKITKIKNLGLKCAAIYCLTY